LDTKEHGKTQMQSVLDQCDWPDLAERYDQALREAVRFVLQRFDVFGIVVSGTIVRGNPDPTSDLDVYVIHREQFRQRIQKFFNGVPAEIFVNPPQAIRQYFDGEQKEGRPCTAHMLATGFVVLARDPVVDELQAQARDLLVHPPESTPLELDVSRYMIACMYEDATDVVERDPVAAQMLLSRAVTDMLEFCFKKAGCFIPRRKELLRALAEIDPETVEEATEFSTATDLDARLRLAERLADRTIGVRGFFEWETTPELVV
jgi:predicted nucleotidyltransferase